MVTEGGRSRKHKPTDGRKLSDWGRGVWGESHPAAARSPWLPSPGLRPRCRWTGGTPERSRSRPWSTPGPGQRGEEETSCHQHAELAPPLIAVAIRHAAVLSTLGGGLTPKNSKLNCVSQVAASTHLLSPTPGFSSVKNRKCSEHEAAFFYFFFSLASPLPFPTKALSRPPPCKLPVTAVCKVWSDSWVIVLK